MKKCPKCNAVYDDNAVYCSKCGTELVQENVCPECGYELPENAKFCPRCGHKMAEEVEQEVVDSKPGANSRFTEAEINQMRKELVAHRRRERSFKIAGSVLLGVGAPLFVVGLIVMVLGIIGTAYDGGYDPLPVVGIVLGYLALFFGLFMSIGSIPLLVVASAIFGKKADNREEAIREFEGK